VPVPCPRFKKKTICKNFNEKPENAFILVQIRGLYIGKHPPTPQRKGKNISRCHLKRKNMKKGREKGGKCKRKGRKGKEKGRKGKEQGRKGKEKKEKGK
jgi:hypothetical protein